MRDLFTQHVVAVFVERAAKAWSPHAIIQVFVAVFDRVGNKKKSELLDEY